ncbi:MAG: FAD-binding oxidoreductase [Bosea sp. (in: a-proteobacteria)]
MSLGLREAAADTMPDRIAALIADLGDVPVITEEKVVRRRSRDFFWYSPILNVELAEKFADLIVAPRNEAEVIATVKACVAHGVPLTPRAGGTGNYGQAVPLQGGVLLDMTGLTRILWSKPGVVRVEAGAKMHEIDFALKDIGWELRLHPSTKRTATIGGFVAGGSGGVGSVTWGGLREPGNILAARIVTVEAEPRVIELRGDAAQKINRAYGTTGIILELEMPLAPTYDWMDAIIAFDRFEDALEAGMALAKADGVVKKLITPVSWPLPSYFGAMKPHCPDGKHVLLVMIAQPWMEALEAVIAGKGVITHSAPTREEAGAVPLYEYAWNHTTLQMLKSDRSITYLQCLFPHERAVESVLEMRDLFPDELIPHCEFIKFGGNVTMSALPVVRYSTAERLNEMIAIHEAHGVMIANPHVVSLEAGSRHKRADADQIGFKASVDPHGLLNPGKMASYVPARPL